MEKAAGGFACGLFFCLLFYFIKLEIIHVHGFNIYYLFCLHEFGGFRCVLRA